MHHSQKHAVAYMHVSDPPALYTQILISPCKHDGLSRMAAMVRFSQRLKELASACVLATPLSAFSHSML